MKSVITHEILNDNGSTFSKTTHENHNLTKAEAIALRGYFAVESIKSLEGFAKVASDMKAKEEK